MLVRGNADEYVVAVDLDDVAAATRDDGDAAPTRERLVLCMRREGPTCFQVVRIENDHLVILVLALGHRRQVYL